MIVALSLLVVVYIWLTFSRARIIRKGNKELEEEVLEKKKIKEEEDEERLESEERKRMEDERKKEDKK